MDPKQSEGRRKNAAIPDGKPEAASSEEDVRRVGRMSRTRAGPDGPDAREIGAAFKKPPDERQPPP